MIEIIENEKINTEEEEIEIADVTNAIQRNVEEYIDTKMGEFNCLKFIPEITENKKNEKTENISPTPKDDMILWISDDPNHVPIRVKFDLFIGSIKCDLIGYNGLKY